MTDNEKQDNKKAYQQKYRAEHVDRRQKYLVGHADELREKRKQKYENNKIEIKVKRKQKLQELRQQALDLYGNICICCKETENQFLSFDHTNNNGGCERKHMGANRERFYRYLIKNKPSDIQILCHNCNLAKGFYGICPHQKNNVLLSSSIV